MSETTPTVDLGSSGTAELTPPCGNELVPKEAQEIREILEDIRGLLQELAKRPV
jgi:hypothetical protein